MHTADVYWEGNPVTGAAVVDYGGQDYVTVNVDGWEGYATWVDGTLPPGDYGHYIIASVAQIDGNDYHVEVESKSKVERLINNIHAIWCMALPAKGRRRWGRAQA